MVAGLAVADRIQPREDGDLRTRKDVDVIDVEDPEGEAVVVNGSGVAWADTRGATRYIYVETERGDRWMTGTEQLHDGAYLGSRLHVRLYEVDGGGGTLTAVQAQHEHWDWFRLRRTVGSVSRGQYAVEQEFYGTGLIRDVSRDRFGNGGILDADDWVTVVDLVERGGRSRLPRSRSGSPSWSGCWAAAPLHRHHYRLAGAVVWAVAPVPRS